VSLIIASVSTFRKINIHVNAQHGFLKTVINYGSTEVSCQGKKTWLIVRAVGQWLIARTKGQWLIVRTAGQ